MISFESKGSFNNLDNFFKRMSNNSIRNTLERFGQAGVDALAKHTPTDSGETANSWTYKVVKSRRGYSVEWYNSNSPNGVQVAVLIQYGHGTGTGGYVNGIDYINPAIRPIFDGAITEIWKEVQR